MKNKGAWIGIGIGVGSALGVVFGLTILAPIFDSVGAGIGVGIGMRKGNNALLSRIDDAFKSSYCQKWCLSYESSGNPDFGNHFDSI